MSEQPERLRVALLAASLYQGGAEKQLLYMARALVERSVEVRVYSLTQGQHYEPALRDLGLDPIFIGRYGNPLVRALSLARHVRQFKAHILQTSNFFAIPHVAVAGRLTGTISLGALRNDTDFEVDGLGKWGGSLLRLPTALIANSHAGRKNAMARGVAAERVHVLPNVIDLEAFDVGHALEPANWTEADRPVFTTVCRLVKQKRLERFLAALQLARQQNPSVQGMIVGDGPERETLEAEAKERGLLPDGVRFVGRRDDVPAVLNKADGLIVCSDHEGTPNVVMEAMAARLPVITTPAGDSSHVALDGETGFVVPFEDAQAMAERMCRLADAPELRRQLGESGRVRIEKHYGFDTLADRMLNIYRDVAEQRGKTEVLRVIDQERFPTNRAVVAASGAGLVSPGAEAECR